MLLFHPYSSKLLKFILTFLTTNEKNQLFHTFYLDFSHFLCNPYIFLGYLIKLKNQIKKNRIFNGYGIQNLNGKLITHSLLQIQEC